MSDERLIIFDTTLRDGEQAPGFSMNTAEKLQLARQLQILGVDVLEAGFPIASSDDAEAVRLIASEIKGPVIAGLARCARADIECAGESVKPAERSRIHSFIATSDLHLERKLRISREDCLQAVIDNVKLARDYTDDVEFSAEDATRTDPDFLCQVVETAIAQGATTVNLPDTVGYCTPDEIEQFFVDIIGRVPNSDKAVFSTHCHDDLGLAVANSLASVRGGCRQVECTINGIGERAGNASLEEIVMVTRVRGDRVPYTTGIETTALFATSQLVSALTHEPVQANKAIVGRNAFAHEAGIHQDGVIKDRRTYEIMRPGDVGVAQSTLVLGKHSGRHAVRQRCEQLGIELTRLELDRVYRAMIDLADRQKTIGDPDLTAIVELVRGEEPGVCRMQATIALLPGDGIGPEVTSAAEQVLRAVADRFGHTFVMTPHLVGGAALRAGHPPLPDATRDACVQADAVFLGAVGDPAFDVGSSDRRPETALLQLRQTLGVFANLRPARVWPGLEDGGAFRPDRVAGVDMLIIRELTGGIYYGEPRGIADDGLSAFNTMRYSRSEVERIAEVAFKSAATRRGHVTSVDKANVLETSRLWREVVTDVGTRYPEITLEHQYVDSCALLLATHPKQFDVVLSGNLFGDILSDEAGAVVGSLGLLPSASIGGRGGLFEPVHGSAPTLAGRDVANPIGAIASSAMLLRHALGANEEADAVEQAIGGALAAGHRTADLVTDQQAVTPLSGSAMAQQIVDRLAVPQPV